MGHPSDWDGIRAGLADYQTDATEITVAENWSASIEQLAESAPPSSILIGYSMGARLALGLALKFPRRFSGLVFVSGNPGLESASDREQRRLSDEQIAKRIESEALEPFFEQWYQAEVFASLSGELRHQEIQRKLRRASKDWPAILRANSVSQQPNFWPQLNELSVPMLVVAGELDQKYKAVARRIETEVTSANVTTTIVPQCGHIVHREQPESLIGIIRNFAEQLGSRTG